MLILSVLVAGSEYSWGTIKTVLTRRPSRLAVYGGKVLALGGVVTLVVLLIFALAAAASAFVAATEGEVARQASAPAIAAHINQAVPFGEGFAERRADAIAEALPRAVQWPSVPEIGIALGVAWLGLALFAALGLFLGTFTRGTALAMGVGLVWLEVVEPQLAQRAAFDPSLQNISQWLLTVNITLLMEPIYIAVPALADVPTLALGNPFQVQAALVLAGYTVAFLVLGALLLRTRDVQ